MMRARKVLRTAATAMLTAFWVSTACAEALRQPEGPVILSVSGDLDVTNVGDEAHFDLAMLDELGAARIETSTIWTDGVQVFEGTPVAAVLAALGVQEGTVRAVALNDYAVEIPVSDLVEGHALLAHHRNGAPMSVRDKGPLWVVYPYDSDPRFQTEVYYSRSIWQLNRLSMAR